MDYKRILSIQDISCFGQCSLTVALPIVSACGVECSVLPAAILSTHTGGFTGFTFRDLTEDMPLISSHWQKENIKYDGFYTGYLSSANQIDYVLDIFNRVSKPSAIKVVDPAMADNGKLYVGFDTNFVKQMAQLCVQADYVLPNITEASFLTDIEYKTEYNKDYIDNLLEKLTVLGCKNIVLTGVSYNEKTTGVVVFENGKYSYYEHEKLPVGSHGTGDVFASAFMGALMRGKTVFDAVKIAADYTLECIKYTTTLDNHRYGAAFEPIIPKLVQMLNN